MLLTLLRALCDPLALSAALYAVILQYPPPPPPPKRKQKPKALHPDPRVNPSRPHSKSESSKSLRMLIRHCCERYRNSSCTVPASLQTNRRCFIILSRRCVSNNHQVAQVTRHLRSDHGCTSNLPNRSNWMDMNHDARALQADNERERETTKSIMVLIPAC